MKLKETIDFMNGILPSKGSVLLSEPFLQDPHFERSVVLMCEHSDAESFGFVLNHLSAVQLHDLMDIAPKEIPIFIGGPVANNSLFYLHTIPGIESSEEILPGLFYGGDLAELIEASRWFAGVMGRKLPGMVAQVRRTFGQQHMQAIDARHQAAQHRSRSKGLGFRQKGFQLGEIMRNSLQHIGFAQKRALHLLPDSLRHFRIRFRAAATRFPSGIRAAPGCKSANRRFHSGSESNLRKSHGR